MKEPHGFQRQIGLMPLALIAIGACIGSGIFLTPSDIAAKVPHADGILIAWMIGGVVALTGSLTFAELGSRYPGIGGVYAYLREAYGDLVAFLYGWVSLTVITSGAIAALVLACVRYLDYFLPIGPEGVPIVGTVLLILLTLINIRGVRSGAGVASALTLMKILGIGMIVAVSAWYLFSTGNTRPPGNGTWGVSGLGLALVGVFWSYGGWHHASYLAGETIQPAKTVPRAMIIGALVVTTVYVTANWAYLQLLSPAEIAQSSAVAADAIGQVFHQGGVFIALLIILSTLGTASIYTLSAPRLYYSMGHDGSFLPQLARIHPRFQTPYLAILLQSTWSIVLLWFWSTFENLITYVVFMDVVFMVMAAVGIFIFRRRPEQEMPAFRVPFFPFIPLIYICLCLWFLGTVLWSQPVQAWAGLLVCSAGIPVFWWFRRDRKQQRS
ncbi:MAG: amino acid permease [Saprospiraceae bacterium]|nr:amino acid permease [Saprospiraceae bacterium]